MSRQTKLISHKLIRDLDKDDLVKLTKFDPSECTHNHSRIIDKLMKYVDDEKSLNIKEVLCYLRHLVSIGLNNNRIQLGPQK